ncbi:hypothetical protein ACFUOZ_21300, partial [Paenarthrobacter sp. NPDC057355]|uniref:hypothetical protein n=1 Tax=Paenarthrobacter sp. NPDC057355 TaxID=3346105 RepID=UPI0036254891
MTLTLFVFVDVGVGPAAQAAPPPVVVTTPPRVTDPSTHRQIGFPSDYFNSDANAGPFRVVEVRDGHWVADRPRPTWSEPNKFLKPFKEWPQSYTDAVWQQYVDEIAASLDRISSSPSGETVVKVSGKLKPEPGGSNNEWLDWTPKSPGEAPAKVPTGDVGVVYFPTEGAEASAGRLKGGMGQPSSGYVTLDPQTISSYYDLKTGKLKGQDPHVSLAHELGHVANYKANSRPPRGTTYKMPYSVWSGGDLETPGSQVSSKKFPIEWEELMVHGSEGGRAGVINHLQENPNKSPIPVTELSTHSNPWRTKAARDALSAPEPRSAADVERIELLSEFASVNPTEVKIAGELETGIRPEYLNAQYRGREGSMRDGPRLEREPNTPRVLKREVLEDPLGSRLLRVAGGQPPVPVVCGSGDHGFCSPGEGESEPMSEEEVKAFEEDVKTRVELEKGRTSEGVFFDSLSVEDLQVLAGMGVTGSPEMVRESFSFT